MAKAILEMKKDPVTGERKLSISYVSDSDALPIEHEEGHSDLLDKVFDGGVRASGVKLERDRSRSTETTRQEESQVQQQTVKQNG